MEISKQEAQESLGQIEDSASRMRKLIASGGDTLYILWGILWIIGFMGTQGLESMGCQAWFIRFLGSHGVASAEHRSMVVGNLTGGLWFLLVAGGIIASLVISRRRTPVRNPRLGKRIGLFWFFLYAYLNLWIYWMQPFFSIKINGAAESALFWRHYGAVAATIPMFAYVVTGLWLDHLMIWIGLGITALTFLGLQCFPQWFWIWMAVMGGGTLIGTGLIIRNRWR